MRQCRANPREVFCSSVILLTTTHSNMTTSLIDNLPENKPLIDSADHLQSLIESFIEVGVLVHDNQGTPQSRLVLVNKLHQIVNQLASLNAIDRLKEFPIPVDIISYIEDGRNPDIYTREFLEVNAKSNARLKGKFQNFNKLQQVLSEKVAQEFPELKSTIDDINERTS